jgi:DNA-binding MarR family transcriptional regulator
MRNNLRLHPTLWRTCRVLANRTRLQIFCFLIDHPHQTVSTIARRLNLALPITSKSLRSLESRTLLVAHRSGSFVRYSVVADNRATQHGGLATVLRKTLVADNRAEKVDTIFSLVTAFTHPRRIEIFRALQSRPQRLEQLQTATGISLWALSRHLKKLEDRGFIRHQRGRYRVAEPTNDLPLQLMRLAGR